MEQLVSYLMHHQQKVKFPDRTATLVRNRRFMTQLDFFDVQEAQYMQWEDQQQHHAAAQAALQMGQGVAEAEAAQHHRHQDHNAAWWGALVNWDAADDHMGGGRCR